MSENGRKKRKTKRVPPTKGTIYKRDKIIWITIVIIFVLLVCFFLFLEFIKHFVSI